MTINRVEWKRGIFVVNPKNLR